MQPVVPYDFINKTTLRLVIGDMNGLFNVITQQALAYEIYLLVIIMNG